MRWTLAGIIYISHRLDELPSIADRVTVLRDGCTIETRSMAEITREELIRLMVGRELSAIFPKRAVEPGETALELRGVGCSSAGVAGVNLSVRRGEIVGLAGLVGAGRTELAKTIFGLTPADQGETLVRGEAVDITSPPVLKVYPNVKVIMAIAAPAVPGAAEAVKQSGRADVKVTGLSLPNMCKPYVHGGIIESIVLWNTLDLGYLTVYASHALSAGQLKRGDQSVAAGRLGRIEVQNDEVRLGAPFIFNKTNIDGFNF